MQIKENGVTIFGKTDFTKRINLMVVRQGEPMVARDDKVEKRWRLLVDRERS